MQPARILSLSPTTSRRRALAGWGRALPALLAAFVGLAPVARAQVSFSIDYGGPTISLPDAFGGVPITEGDILAPAPLGPLLGPLPQPGILISGGAGGLALPVHPGAVGHPPGIQGNVEVDALSYGADGPAWQNMPPGSFWFSVDEFAASLGGIPVPPCSDTEGVTFALEAGADAFIDLGLPPAPLPPFAAAPANTGAIDGNGFFSLSGFAYPGLGLLEWNPPGLPPDLGDNVDALDLQSHGPGPAVYFSLDSFFMDPLLGIPNGTSAGLNGPYVGGDVLRCPFPGVAPLVYAPAALLGLDIILGPDHDDLDAVAVWENGIPGFQPSATPYDWTTGQTDMVLFSVRRGSSVIGFPDSIFGIPIEEGDILTTPLQGGMSPFPGIFIAAENLGLDTARSSGIPFGDDLDALSVSHLPLFDGNNNGQEDAIDIVMGVDPDGNMNGVPDSCDIAWGSSADLNGNGTPDEVEFGLATAYCAAKVSSQGCTPIIGAFGTPSATWPGVFDISAVNVISGKNGLLFYGYAPAAIPFQGAWLCVAPPIRRTMVQNSGGVFPPNNCTGSYTYDFNARIQGGVDPLLVAGVWVYVQYWYRDPGDPTGFGTGLSDGLSFAICP